MKSSNDEEKKSRDFTWKEALVSGIWGTLLFIQFIQTFFINNYLSLTTIFVIGFIFWAIAIYFAIIPFFTFKKRGGVAKGKSYMETTKLVDTGIYAIVRHSQFLGGILWSLAMILVTQHWLNLICGVPVMILIYYEMIRAENDLIKKFGNEYKEYMKKVPRANFLWGIIKYLRRKK
jgi:protein-S-isoprenylcysteine O-methyltransferase Ste14